MGNDERCNFLCERLGWTEIHDKTDRCVRITEKLLDFFAVFCDFLEHLSPREEGISISFQKRKQLL